MNFHFKVVNVLIEYWCLLYYAILNFDICIELWQCLKLEIASYVLLLASFYHQFSTGRTNQWLLRFLVRPGGEGIICRCSAITDIT